MTSDLDPVNNLSLQQKQAETKSERAVARQVSAEEAFAVDVAEVDANPFAADAQKRQMRALEDRSPDIKALAKAIKAAQKSGALDDAALRYQQKNPELNARSLSRLLESLKDDDSQDEILKKVLNFFPDKSIADEALDFLIENTQGALNETIGKAKEGFNKQFGREIVAGKNIATQAREFAKQGLGTTNDLRDLYRDITGNPREPQVLFNELSQGYSFQQLKTVIQFLLHALGGDLRSKGPSIERGELSRLFTETRSLQSILGVYRFFQSRMGLINKLLSDAGITIPKNLTFETMAQLYMKIVEDRYPAAAKIISLAGQLGITGQKEPLITVISQWRDAVRSVSPRLYKTIQARDDIYTALLEALDGLEEEEEEKNEQI